MEIKPVVVVYFLKFFRSVLLSSHRKLLLVYRLKIIKFKQLTKVCGKLDKETKKLQ